MKNYFIGAVAVLALVLSAIGLVGGHQSSSSLGARTPGTEFPHGITVGLASTSPTNLAKVLSGTCTIFAYTNTITASSTADVDCQSGTGAGGVPVAITGIQLGDNVFVTLSTSSPTTALGLVLQSASASTTQGFIHMKISNLTGQTFTWTAAASSSLNYLDVQTQ